MDEEAQALVRRLLQEGQRYDDVRRAVISHGYSTEGFEDEYHNIQNELGIKEPPPSKVSPQKLTGNPAEDVLPGVHDYEQIEISNFASNAIKLFAGFLILFVAFIVLSGYGEALRHMVFGTTPGSEDMTPEDLSRETNLRTMQATAQTYKARLTDYAGLCNSIGVDRNLFNCREDGEAFSIDAILSNGTYFCVDSTGFADVVDEVPAKIFSCTN